MQQSLALYDYYHEQIRDCDRVIEAHLKGMALPEVPPLAPKRRVRRRKDNEVTFDARQRLHHMAGVDLTAIEGIEESTALVVLSEIGTDMSRWPSEKHFGSWLGLAPEPEEVGGQGEVERDAPGGKPCGAGVAAGGEEPAALARVRWGRSSGGSRHGEGWRRRSRPRRTSWRGSSTRC